MGQEIYTNDNDIYWERGVWWRNGEMSKSFMLYLPLTGPHTPWLPVNKFKGKTKLGTYGDFVSQVDDAVGEIINALKSLKIDENTIVVFSSDNGGHHIPLIIQWPAQIKKKFTYSQTAGLVDLMATFSELTGQPVSKKYGEDSL